MKIALTPSRILRAALALCVVVAVTVFVQYRSSLRQERADTARRLSSLADQQALMIADWIESGRVDLRASLALARANGAALAAYQSMVKHSDYVWIQYYDASGRRGAGAALVAGPRNLPDAAGVAAALSSAEGLVDFHFDAASSRPVVDLAEPDRQDGRVVGVLFLRLDPRRRLFGHMQAGHTFSGTSETVLVRRDGDRVSFLSEIAPKYPSLAPLSSPRLAAARALRGETLDGSEVDYRGRRVLAVARPVWGTDWMLIAKIEDAEIASPILRRALARAGIFIGLFLFVAAVFLRLYLRQEEQRVAEEFAAKSEIIEKTRLLDAFFEHSLSPLVFLDRDFNFLRVNEAYAKSCGKKVEDFPGRNHFELYPHAENEGLFRQVVRTKTPHRAVAKPFEFPDHPEWGATYWDWSLVPLLDSSGEVDTLVFSLEDVTERVRAENDLKRHSAELDDIYNRAPCGYHSLGPDGTYLRVNDTELSWLGYSREEVVGRKKFSDLVTPAGVKTFRDAFPAFKERGWVRDLEFDMVRKDGSILPILVSATAVNDERGLYLLSRSTIYDMTDRKRAEEAHARLAAMVEGSDDAIVGKDLDGVITSWNEGARRLYGWTAAEAVGERAQMLLPPGEADEISEILAKIRRGEHVAHFETNRRRKDGRVLRVSLMVSPVKDSSGAIIGASAVARDVTPRWEAERAVAKLSRALRTLSLCNEALVRAQNEGELLDRICRLVVEQGGYLLSWVGFRVDDAEKSVRPVAKAGFEDGYLETLQITWADTERGRGPTGTAIREGTVEICRDFQADARVAPWRAAALDRGFRSSITLPLLSGGRAFGALMIYASEPNAFSDEEIALLKELSEDLAFGIVSLRTRAARESAEAALRKASLYNRSLIEASLDPLVTIGPDGRITDVNLGTETATGRTRAELIGTDFSSYFTKPQEARAGYERAFREGLVRDYPLEILARDGRITPVLYNAAVYRDEKGDVIGVFAAARDVAERRRAEKEREQFFKFFQTSGDLMCLADPQGAFLKTNPAFTETLGYSETELIAKPFVDYIVPEDKQATIDEMARQMQKGFSLNFENRYRCKDGSVKWLSWRAIYNKEDGVTYATARDVTERVRAEEALRALEEKYRMIVENSRDLIALVDREGRYVYASPSYEPVLGYAPKELEGLELFELVKPDLRPELRAVFERSLASPGMTVVETEVLHKNGSWISFEVGGTWLRDAAGEPLQAMLVSRDVTERKRLQTQILHSQKMESVGVLAGGIAHDFNNILMTILGNCSFLLTSLATNDPRRADVEEIKTAEERAAALTRQLLIFSRKQQAQAVVLDLNELVRNFQKMLGRILGEDVKLDTVLSPEPAMMRADPGQLEQVIMNLAVNARDAMPRGGRLSLRVSRPKPGEPCHRDCSGAGIGKGCVRLVVEDTGTGMTPEVQAHLFEPFFTTKPTGKGTGLGLSTVYGIVRQSGGGIAARSVPGQGTAFLIDFPLAEAVAGAAPLPSAAPAAATRGRETILLVEDDEMLRRIDLRLLLERGYRVVTASDGEAALALLKDGAKDADLLLTDVVMPGMGGGELAREALKLKPGLKVIFVSGYVGHGALEQVEAGKYEFLQKPVSPDLLAQKVREVLDRKPAA